ncbi:MAG: hypothetical protein PF518_03835, partial [Spirochaetaceae bacterium]|nr:hypothetical protein [Spirochaetaceae bacterium]
YLHLNIQREGFEKSSISRFRGLLTLPLILFSFFCALLLGKNRSLLSYKTIIRFLQWLSSLKFTSEAIPHEMIIDEPRSESGIQSFDQTSFEGFKEPIIPEEIVKILEIMMMAGTAIVIIYLVFYPLISPLFKKNAKKITMGEYYKKLIKRFFNYIYNLKEQILSLFINNLDERKLFDNIEFDGKPGQSRFNAKKKREIKTILRYFFKICRWAEKKNKLKIDKTYSVTDFFSLLAGENREENEYFSELSQLFNQAFFSSRLMTKKEFQHLKYLVSTIIR